MEISALNSRDSSPSFLSHFPSFGSSFDGTVFGPISKRQGQGRAGLAGLIADRAEPSRQPTRARAESRRAPSGLAETSQAALSRAAESRRACESCACEPATAATPTRAAPATTTPAAPLARCGLVRARYRACCRLSWSGQYGQSRRGLQCQQASGPPSRGSTADVNPAQCSNPGVSWGAARRRGACRPFRLNLSSCQPAACASPARRDPPAEV